jgi:anti-anti-sigma factor
MEAPFSVEVIPDGHSVTLVLAGELDMATAPSLRECLEQMDDRWRTVVLDLAGLTFLDSSGIALLISTEAAFRPDYRTLTIRNPISAVLRILEITGLTEVIPVEGTASPEHPGW